jgi:C-terminal processing protease CtpA/Prc
MIRWLRRLLPPLLAGAALAPARADKAALDLAIARDLLRPVKQQIREEFYDPAFGGADFEGIFRTAEQQLASARTPSEAFAIIAQAVINLGDSHTRFGPPPRPVRIKYGWALQTIGQHVYVQAVKPGSGAEQQGLRPNDRVLTINGLPATRESLPLIRYLLLALNPQPELRVQLQDATGATREVTFAAEVKRLAGTLTYDSVDNQQLILEHEDEARRARSTFRDLAPGVLYWKLHSFGDEDDVAAGLRKCKDYTHVVLDLRGNPGGLQSAMLDAIGAFLGRKTEIGILRERRRTEKLVARSLHTITARLSVLIDAGSSSAAEVFSRVMQLEGRGTVLGDRSAGLVNQGRVFPLSSGSSDRLVPFAVMVTTAALVLHDGQLLEKTGVTPDVWLVPSPKDIAAGHDPVLAAAAKFAGLTLTKAEAGEISRSARQLLYD